MESPLTAADAADWTYRGEGAANLVLGYGGSSPHFMGKVLRIQKAPREGGAPGAAAALSVTDHERVAWGDVEGMAEARSREEAGRAFVIGVMRDLLGRQHVDLGVNILVSKEFLATVENNIAEQRPSWRVDAAVVNTACDEALLMPDYAIFHHDVPKCCRCITVEIKPKCGFIPSSEFISEKNSIKKHVTRFRMHQMLKLSEGEASFIDLDLKLLDKMAYYYELDQKIVNLYSKIIMKKGNMYSANETVGKLDDGCMT